MNTCCFIGTLTDDPKQFGEGDNVVSSFSLAVRRSYASNDGEHDVDYPKFIAKGKQSHLTQLSLKKGYMVGIESVYQTRKIVDVTGNKYFDEFVVDKYTFIKKKE